MTIEQAIAAHLASDATIVSYVAARIYQDEREEGTALPAISFFEIPGGESLQSIDNASVGLAFKTFQINVYAAKPSTANTLRELVRLRFQNHSGIMGGAGGIPVSCLHSGESGGLDPNDVSRTIVRSVDFEFQYQQSQS